MVIFSYFGSLLLKSLHRLSLVSEWLRLLPLLGILALLGYLTIRPFLPKKKKQRDSLINLKIQKENPKVVNEIDIEDLNSTNVCYCRCWRSKTVGPSTSSRFLSISFLLISNFPFLF